MKKAPSKLTRDEQKKWDKLNLAESSTGKDMKLWESILAKINRDERELLLGYLGALIEEIAHQMEQVETGLEIFLEHKKPRRPEVFKLMYRHFIELNKSHQAVANALNDAGVLNERGGKWTRLSVLRYLKDNLIFKSKDTEE